MPVVFCPKCSGKVNYFGEALMASLTCDGCGDYLIGVGREFIKEIAERWISGERGIIDSQASAATTESKGTE